MARSNNLLARLAQVTPLFLAAAIALGPADVSAQAYEPLAPAGELPDDFVEKASRRAADLGERTRSRKKDQRGRRARKDRKRREAFSLETAFALSRYHRSGQILSGDWASALVTRVGRHVAATLEPGRGEDPVRFYVIASPAVNAFATPDRTVYVTMGLLARLESEAQLASVLAHEMGHVEKDHGLQLYLKSVDHDERERKLSSRKRDEDPFAINRYTREKEVEADAFGFDLYGTLGYGGREAVSAFDMLAASYLTFGEYELQPDDLSAFGTDIPSDWLLAELVDPPAAELSDEELEERNTHPALPTRVAEAEAKLGSLDGAAFLKWTPEDLARLRRQARYETVDYQLRDFDNLAAMQNAFALLRTEAAPDSVFLLRTIVQAGLNQAVMKNVYEEVRRRMKKTVRESRGYSKELAREALDDLDDFPDAEDAYGEAQRFYHLFAEAPTDELAAVLFARAVELELLAPKLPSARVLTDRALELLADEGVANVDALRERAPGAVAAAEAADFGLEERMRAARKVSDLWDYNTEDGERLEKQAKRPVALGVKRVLVMPPRYRGGVTKTALFEEDYYATEDGEAEQVDLIKGSMRAAGLRGDVITDALRTSSARQLGEVRTMKSWLQQFQRLEALRLIPHNHDRMLALYAASDAGALVHLSEVETRVKGFSRGFMVPVDLIFYAFFNPYDAVASIVSKRAFRSHLQMVIDPEARRIVHSQPLFVATRQGTVVEKALYYQFFDQIATQPKRR